MLIPLSTLGPLKVQVDIFMENKSHSLDTSSSPTSSPQCSTLSFAHSYTHARTHILAHTHSFIHIYRDVHWNIEGEGCVGIALSLPSARDEVRSMERGRRHAVLFGTASCHGEVRMTASLFQITAYLNSFPEIIFDTSFENNIFHAFDILSWFHEFLFIKSWVNVHEFMNLWMILHCLSILEINVV